MSSSSPSIQSFFNFSSPSKQQLISDVSSEPASSPTKPLPGDAKSWTPTGDYKEIEIGSLVPGPSCITIVGRVANFYNQATPDRMPQSARGCIKMIIKDDTGALTAGRVRLWYRDTQYALRLGTLVSLWTPHVSQVNNSRLAAATAPLFVSMFPEGDRSCHFMVHNKSDDGVLCKTPAGFEPGMPLKKLITLKAYIETAYEAQDSRILACVKSIGAKKKVTSKKREGSTTELVNIKVFDDTAEASLTLWGNALHSADFWTPSSTVLLISNPQAKVDRATWISLSQESQVDIDPSIDDARWLKKYVQKLTKREHINPSCPTVFDLAATLSEPIRVLFTFADLDELVRKTPNDVFTGFVGVIIFNINIMTLRAQNMLFCTQCCGIPICSSITTAVCKQCSQKITLRPNPNIVGTLVDETGSIAPGKLTWSQTAWEQLLGRTPEEFAKSSPELLRYMEKRLQWLRVTLVVGWPGEEMGAGRLCVLGVKM